MTQDDENRCEDESGSPQTADVMRSMVAPEWLLTAVDLDAAAAAEDQHVIGPDDEAGVY